MACGSCGGRNKKPVQWKHIAPNGTETIKAQQYEVEWLLRKHGGSIEKIHA